MDVAVRSGPGIFFDGTTGVRHAVSVELDRDALLVRAAEGHLLACWDYGELEPLSAPEGMLRLGRLGSPVLARLEVHDAALAAAIDQMATTVDRSGATERRSRTKVVLWSIAAVVSLVIVTIFGVPLLADRLTPYVPLSFERRLGEAVDKQIRGMLDTDHKGERFECGSGATEQEGLAALKRLGSRLESAASLKVPITLAVLRKPEANAIALPGGRIYIFDGLIKRAETADEVAGVIAHEIGHVAHRDGTRSMLQAAGLSFMLGMVLGDFVGGGAVVIAGRTLLQTSYSREVERHADAFGVELMTRLNADAHALGAILVRIDGSSHPGIKLLLDHPDTRDRLAAIKAAALPKTITPLLSPAEWTALKRICGGP